MPGPTGLATQLRAGGDLHYAKQEAYDPINALTRTRAVPGDTRADESRWLLEGRTAALQTSFFQKASSVAAVPGIGGTQAGGDLQGYYSGPGEAVRTLDPGAGADSVSGVTIGWPSACCSCCCSLREPGR